MRDINIKILIAWYAFLVGHSMSYEPSKKCNCTKSIKKSILKPILYPKMKANQLLCIGLNPSHSEEFYCKENIPSDVFKTTTFSFKPNSLENQKLKDLYVDGINKYHYYSPFKEISQSLDVGKEHIDIFMFRESCSKCLKQFNEKNPAFANKQKEITKQLITKLSPLMILVGNAEASRIFKDELFPGKCIYLKNHGYHLTEIDKSLIPTFLSGQLSGGATDQYSRLRLEYLMRKAKLESEDFNKLYKQIC